METTWKLRDYVQINSKKIEIQNSFVFTSTFAAALAHIPCITFGTKIKINLQIREDSVIVQYLINVRYN